MSGSSFSGLRKSTLESYKTTHKTARAQWRDYANFAIKNPPIGTPVKIEPFFDYYSEEYGGSHEPSLAYIIKSVLELLEAKIPYSERKMQRK
jgi:hypothetical protein